MLTVYIQIWSNDHFSVKYFHKKFTNQKKTKTFLDYPGLIWELEDVTVIDRSFWLWRIFTQWIQEMISFSIFQIANQQYCISFQLSHNLFTAARRQDPLGNLPNICNVRFYYIFHLATALCIIILCQSGWHKNYNVCSELLQSPLALYPCM